MTNMERDILVSRIRQDPEKAYIVTHGTDTLIETAKYLRNSSRKPERINISLNKATAWNSSHEW